MSYEPHLKRGGELYHYRTVGSRNGYSKDPNYRPKGQKAVGKLVNGRYVYSIQPKKTSLSDRFNAARKSAGNWLSDRGRDVSKAASSAKKTAGRLASKVGSSAKKAAKYVTGGSKAREKVNETKFRLDVAKTYGGSTKTALASSHNQRKAANSRKAANNYEKSYANRSILDFRGQNSDAKGAIKEKSNAKKYQKAADENKALNNQIKREQVADARAKYNEATKAYNNTLEGKLSKTANKAKKTASKALNDAGKSLDSARKSAGDWLSDRGEDISKTANNVKKSASKALNDAGKKAKKAGESVSKFASDSFDSAKKTASEGAKRAGEFISGLGKKAGKAANDARKSINETVDDIVKTGGKNLNSAKKKAKDFVDYKITGEGQKRDEKARKDAINKAEANLSTAKTAKDREKGLRDLIKAAGDNPSSKDTKASHWINRIKKNLETIDRLEDEIKRGTRSGRRLKEAREEIAEARIDNELTVGEFYGNKNASGKWGPMYNYENGQKQLNQKNINPDNTPNNVSQQEWDRYVAENYGHYPNRGRHKKENKYLTEFSEDWWKAHRTDVAVPLRKQDKNFAKVETVTSNRSSKSSSKSKTKSSNSAKSDYERELEFNSRKNNEFGMGNASENPNFSYYTVDKETGKTVWVDKNGKKHYN